MKMEIGGIKLGKVLQRVPVHDGDELALPRDETVSAQLLQSPVGVHR